jgi:hypothetical protein
MHLQIKNTLKNNHNHTSKYTNIHLFTWLFLAFKEKVKFIHYIFYL